MSESSLQDAIRELAEPAVQEQGLEIWGIEINESGRMLVRIYVEAPSPAETVAISPNDEEQEQNISATVDQCESISRQLAFALDAEDIIPRAYTLEVSSPGFNRIFFTPAQMVPYVGDMIEARMFVAFSPADGIAPRRVWRGILTGINDEGCTLEAASADEDGTILREELAPVFLPFSSIRRSHRIHIFVRPQKPGSGPKPGKAKKNNQAKAQTRKNS